MFKVAGVLTITLFGLVATPALAQDGPDCESLLDYDVALQQVIGEFNADIEEASIPVDKSSEAWSPGNWTDFSSITADFSQVLATVEPPEFAVAWHDALSRRIALYGQFAQTASNQGPVDALDMMSDSFAENATELQAASDAAIAACAEFAVAETTWSESLAVTAALVPMNGDAAPNVIVPELEITAPIDGRTAGEPDAPIAVMEWGDYQ